MTEGPFTETWGPERFGDPCRECDLDWSFSANDAVTMVIGVPATFRSTIGQAKGSLKHPDLGWTLGAYVCHVADNLNIWAQWLAGAARDGEFAVPGYDESELGDARYYNEIPVGGALWHLEQAVASWKIAVDIALAGDVVLQHATRGPQRARDVVRSNAHDAFHHRWDISRIIGHNSDRWPV